MSAIDKTLGVDWSHANSIGDGVYVMRVDGDIALRTDLGDENHVIVLETRMLEELNKFDQRTRGMPGQESRKSRSVTIQDFRPLDQESNSEPRQEQNPTREVRINAPVGLIPVGAKLEHHTQWLEMVGTHKINGRNIHPLTISLPPETVDELNDMRHTGRWILKRVEGQTAVVGPEPNNNPPQQPKR